MAIFSIPNQREFQSQGILEGQNKIRAFQGIHQNAQRQGLASVL